VGTQDGTPGTTVAAVTAQLEAADRLQTYLGASAVALAHRIDQSTAVMGFAALVKELRSTMDAALAGVKVADDPIDELRARRDGKRAS
jgi:HPt (histidine-containing phosphotransfer) domain-containing protein